MMHGQKNIVIYSVIHEKEVNILGGNSIDHCPKKHVLVIVCLIPNGD